MVESITFVMGGNMWGRFACQGEIVNNWRQAYTDCQIKFSDESDQCASVLSSGWVAQAVQARCFRRPAGNRHMQLAGTLTAVVSQTGIYHEIRRDAEFNRPEAGATILFRRQALVHVAEAVREHLHDVGGKEGIFAG